MTAGRWLAIPRSRWSLRTRVVAATLFVAFAPLLLVFAWTQLDRPTIGRLWGNVRDALDDVKAGAEPVQLGEIAAHRRVWIRVVRADGELVVDVNHDRPHEPLEELERFFLGVPPAPPLSEIDLARGPISGRRWVAAARTDAPTIDCSFEYAVVFCEATRRIAPDAVVIATQSSSRGLMEVYGLRRRLLRLALVTSPLALLVAWLTARRVVRPLEALKRQALARMRERRGESAETRDEVHDLARTLDELLSELERRKVEHERFVADLVHELKSPVAAVRAAAEALAGGSADERTARLTRALEASGGRLESVIARFLDLSRAEAGFPEETREPVDLGALVTECIAEDARREIAAEVEPGLVVNGIEARLSAMIRELLDNALSFAEHVSVSARREGGAIVVRVSDDGPGIAPADLERIFDRYFTTRGDARGTGLGLPLVRAVAEAHGGSAWAESSGRGAVVGARLPAG